MRETASTIKQQVDEELNATSTRLDTPSVGLCRFEHSSESSELLLVELQGKDAHAVSMIQWLRA